MSLRTETTYKACGPGKAAQHAETRGSCLQVNAEVVQLEFAFLSGEALEEQSDQGVSRGHSTVQACTGRPELDRRSSTAGSPLSSKTPDGREEERETPSGKHGGTPVNLLEQVLSRDNMLKAWKRVKANKGAPGMDGMSVEEFPEFTRQHWERIRSALEQGTYRPASVMRVMIPKMSGGERPLGIPTVLDRVIQQAVAQVVAPLFEPHFSVHSHGFRPGHSAHDALREITARSNGKSMRQRIPVLQSYVRGWLNYYGHSHSYSQLLELEQWVRRRVRLCF